VQCHPFYTRKQKLMDTAGRVERFRQKYRTDKAAGWAMDARLRQALARAEEVARELADPATARNPAKLRQLGRESARLEAIRQIHARLERMESERVQAREVLQEKD